MYPLSASRGGGNVGNPGLLGVGWFMPGKTGGDEGMSIGVPSALILFGDSSSGELYDSIGKLIEVGHQIGIGDGRLS